MYVGDKGRIDISSSQFSDFISKGNLYIDKTVFIEHIFNDTNTVILLTRPRRMGKSLNLNTLYTFLDCKQETVDLFSDLYIEKSPLFSEVNKYPVIFLSFKNLSEEDYKRRFKDSLEKIARKYIPNELLSSSMKKYFNDDNNNSPGALLDLSVDIHSALGIRPFILIDEYDKPLMDNLKSPEFTNMKAWFTAVLGAALKDNASLGKAVLTGVTKIAKENMFSGVNNLMVYDILAKSEYDKDFSLTEQDVKFLIEPYRLSDVKKWYNNMRVGNTLLFNIFSIMSYLRSVDKTLDGYWSMTGGTELLSSLLSDLRAKEIANMLENEHYCYITKLNRHLNLEHLRDASYCDDISFYTLAVQAGYLSFNNIDTDYEVFIPNEESRHIWARLVMDTRYKGADNQLHDIFAKISDVDSFSIRLTAAVSMALSYYDFVKQVECVYHFFFLGLVFTLGYECKSNQEAGMGRFDILIKSPEFSAVIEFKSVASSTNKALETGTEAALKQIDEKEYFHDLLNIEVPIYKIGIACHGKKCLVKAIRHGSKE